MILHTPTTHYAVDPDELARVLAAEAPAPVLDTGLIKEDVLRVWSQGDKRVVIGYRKPQLTGIWLEGSKDPLRVPLPGLLLARLTSDNFKQVRYHIVAVKRRPQPNSKLFVCPLPNVDTNGVCWGSVSKPSVEVLRTPDLSGDWQQLLGSEFGNHSVNKKCVSQPKDIRKLFISFHEKKAKRYPKAEYVPLNKTFDEWMNGLIK